MCMDFRKHDNDSSNITFYFTVELFIFSHTKPPVCNIGCLKIKCVLIMWTQFLVKSVQVFSNSYGYDGNLV